MKLFTGVVGAAVVAIPMMFSQAAVAADGEALYKGKGCAGCHAPNAMGAVGPRLAGQQEKYVLAQFKLIRDGKRASGQSAMMAGAVKNVTDEEAAAIAKYVSGL